MLALAATPLHLLGFPEGSLGMLEEGELLAKELGETRRLAFFYGRLSNYHSYKGNALLGVRYSEDALQEGRRSEDLDLIVPIAYGLVGPYSATGQFEKIAAATRDVVDLLEKQERQSDFFGLPANPYAVLAGFCGVGIGTVGIFEKENCS